MHGLQYIFIFFTKVKPIVDSRIIKVHGGKGGDGCISLARICNNPMAGPDGGDGGNGGHITFKVSHTIYKSMLDIYYFHSITDHSICIDSFQPP